MTVAAAAGWVSSRSSVVHRIAGVVSSCVIFPQAGKVGYHPFTHEVIVVTFRIKYQGKPVRGRVCIIYIRLRGNVSFNREILSSNIIAVLSFNLNTSKRWLVLGYSPIIMPILLAY